MNNLKLTLTLLCWLFSTAIPVIASDDPDVLEFALITDTHKWGPSADVRFADTNIEHFLDYCDTHPELEFALYGGDFMNAYNTNHDQALYCLEHGRRDFERLKIPFYVTKGNHDCNGKCRTKDGKKDNTQIITDHEFYTIFHPLSPSNPLGDPTGIVIDPEKPEGNYYYRDFPKHKFRLIVLNDYDKDSLEFYGYHGAQMKWLAETALDFTDKEDPTNWCFLLLGHGFGFNMFGKPISRLLHAYMHGEDFEDEDDGYYYSCRFHEMPRARIVALIGGHNHEDLYDCPDGYNIIHVNRGFSTGGEVGVEDDCFDHFVLNTREHTLLEKRIGRGRTHLFSYDPAGLIEPETPFKDAEGMGNFTHGGQTGRPIWVTNLNDDGEGSLRWAVSQKGERLVCFKVGGIINLQSPLVIDNDSISICGHSAPGQGIMLMGAPIKINASEVIIRYIHLRGHGIFDGDFGQYGLMLDHLSISFTNGPAISIRRTKDVTVQNCLISHTLKKSDSKDSDDDAALIAGGYMATYYHNLITDCPNAICFPSNEGENRWPHIVRNIICNWQDHAMYGGGRQGEITIEENYMIPGSATKNEKFLDVAPDGTGRYYVSKNLVKGHDEFYWWNAKMVNDRAAMPYDPAPSEYDAELRKKMDPVAVPQKGDFASSCLVIAAFHYRGLFTRPTPNQLQREMLLSVGCSLQRDTYDTALMTHFKLGKPLASGDGLISSASQVGGYPKVPTDQHEPKYTALVPWMESRTTQEKSIVILYENDVHCSLEGYPLLAGYRDAIRSDSAYLAIVSVGDYLKGNLTSTISNGQYIIDLMKFTGYDAVGIGGHEFDFKIPRLKELVSQLGVTTCCNLVNEANNETVFPPYIIRQYGSRKVAFIGVTSPRFYFSNRNAFRDETTHTYYNLSDVTIWETVQKNVDKARAAGADYVVMLGFMGEDDKTSRHFNAADLISNTTGIDVLLDGFTHTPVICQRIKNKEGKEVLLSRTRGHFKNIGKLIIAPDGLITTELLQLDGLRFKSPAATHMYDSIYNAYSEYIRPTVGQCRVTLENKINVQDSTNWTLETNMCDLCADALRWKFNAQIGMINQGCCTGTLKPGPFNRGQLVDLCPHSDEACLVEISGKTLLNALSVMLRGMRKQPVSLFEVSGLRYTITPNCTLVSAEVLAPSGQYLAVNEEQTYTMATTEYMLTDILYEEAFADCKRITPSVTNCDKVMEAYIKEHLHGVIGQDYAVPKRRITVKQ